MDEKKTEENIINELKSEDYDTLQQIHEKMQKKELKYREKKGRKWVVMLLGMILLGILGWIMIPYINQLQHSLYNRLGLEGVVKEKFGETRVNEAITEEIMIVAYDFENHVPVLFTKHAARNEARMNVLIRQAA